ncbi:hypothetical protein [Brochothrix thermosphacta]|uniref:hypothetical protein n=1 Tax=Brochothrix thermosphacta TaxID=2756 RepID=UPI00048E48C3|nr:hypothetical protein [Brochothrix thermosphacta]ODJ51480.1 hypothetical protein BFR34_00890 [Brochothrix thermosphacta DSM 20171 = FSL F6-1036]
MKRQLCLFMMVMFFSLLVVPVQAGKIDSETRTVAGQIVKETDYMNKKQDISHTFFNQQVQVNTLQLMSDGIVYQPEQIQTYTNLFFKAKVSNHFKETDEYLRKNNWFIYFKGNAKSEAEAEVMLKSVKERPLVNYQKTNEVKGENTYTISAYTSSEIFESEKVVRIMGTFKEYDNGRIMGETKRYIEFNTAELIEHQTEKIK